MSGAGLRAPESTADLLALACEHLDAQHDDGPVARSVFTVQHGTRLASDSALYRNQYVLVRVAGAFGGCALEASELAPELTELSGMPVRQLLEHPCLPVRTAALDAWLAARQPHRDDPRARPMTLPRGTPDTRARARDAAVAQLLPVAAGQRIALIGVVNPLVAPLRARGAEVLPYRWRDDLAEAFARQHGAYLASHERRFTGGFSLSPTSLLKLQPAERLVLPSPNGATLCAIADELCPGHVLTACLRNASAVGGALRERYTRLLVVPAGERWPDGSLRPALEDWLGAGAVIAALGKQNSPEAQAAANTFRAVEGDLSRVLKECSSGRELHERGFGADVELAAQHDVSQTVPHLQAGALRALS